MKKLRRPIVALGVVFAMLFGASAAYASHEFPDVPDSHPFHDDIDFLAERSITGGFGDGTYRPNDNVTRGQMARFMTRLADALTPIILQTGSSESISNTDIIVCEISGYVAPDYEQQAVITSVISVEPTVTDTTSYLNPQFSNNGGTSWNFLNSGSPEQYLEGGQDSTMAATAAHAINPSGTYSWRNMVSSYSGGSGQTYCDMVITIYHRMPGDAVDPAGAIPSEQS